MNADSLIDYKCNNCGVKVTGEYGERVRNCRIYGASFVQTSEISVNAEAEIYDKVITRIMAHCPLSQDIRDIGTVQTVWIMGIQAAYDVLLPYLRQPEPVSLIDCAMALQDNERIKVGANLQAIAKTVLDAVGMAYVD